MRRIRAGGSCVRVGNYLKYLKAGPTEKRGRETKILKRWGRGKLGQGVGALKRGAGTPLQTMVTLKLYNQN